MLSAGAAFISIGGGMGYIPSDRLRISAGAGLKRRYFIDFVESERENQQYDRTIHVTPIILDVSVTYRIINKNNSDR
ncbi:MAG: hypothetical protein JXR67_04965 [Bacteroidales bacterium]|nr:hypothetical protein [Bacteroidales bacterium]